MLTANELLTKKKPVFQKVTLVLDGEVADRWAKAQAKLVNAKTDDDKADAQDEIDELQPLLADAQVELTMQSVGRRQYQSLVELHQPTDKQKRDAKKDGNVLLFDPETFPVALVAASLVEPKMTEDEVKALFDSENFNDVELAELFTAAFTVNNTSKIIDLGKGSGLTQD